MSQTDNLKIAAKMKYYQNNQISDLKNLFANTWGQMETRLSKMVSTSQLISGEMKTSADIYQHCSLTLFFLIGNIKKLMNANILTISVICVKWLHSDRKWWMTESRHFPVGVLHDRGPELVISEYLGIYSVYSLFASKFVRYQLLESDKSPVPKG